jgi:sortase (surface protein transpeptidase)
VGAVVGTLVGITVSLAVGAGSISPPPQPPVVGRVLPPEALTAYERLDVVDRQAPPPRRIMIRAIGVSAPVVSLGLNPDGTMQVPDNTVDAGWFRPGPEPGERGPAVIAGHVDSTSGPGVFYRLSGLRRGDLIRIRRTDGSVVHFRVQGLERWPKTSFPTRRVFSRTHGSTLRLITCSGSFDSSTGHYTDNTIVYAARVRATRKVHIRAPLMRWRGVPHLVSLSGSSGGSRAGGRRP